MSAALETIHGVDPIDEFLDMSKTNDLASLRIVVQRVLSHPKIFAGFSELLTMPNFRALSSSSISNTNEMEKNRKESQALCNTLELFAFGSMKDYVLAPPGKYLTLSPSQEYKLKQLTIMTLLQGQNQMSRGHPKKVSYATLLAAVSPSQHDQSFQSLEDSKEQQQLSNRALEDLLISCIYSNLISGKLDQRNQYFLIKPPNETHATSDTRRAPFVSRDVPLSTIPNMIQTLEKWRKKSNQIISVSLEEAITKKQDMQNEDYKMWQHTEEKMDEIRSKLHGGGTDASSSKGSTISSSSGGRMAVSVGNSGINSSTFAPRSAYKANRKRYYE